MRFLTLAFVLALCSPDTVFSTSIPKALVGIDYYDPLQHSHLVVRGTVRSAREQTSSEAGWDIPGAPSMVTTVRVSVEEVMRGVLVESEIEFASMGAVLPLFVNDREYVFCAMSRSVGSRRVFVVSPRLGLYARDGGSWDRVVLDTALDTRETLTDEQLRARLERARLANIARSSDVIARGTVVGKRESNYVLETGETGSLIHFTLKTTEVLKGEVSGEFIEFVVAKVGGADFVPNWYRRTPRGITEGQQWLVFLRSGDRGLYPFGGPNSLLRVEGELLIYDNAVEYPDNVKEALGVVRAEAR